VCVCILLVKTFLFHVLVNFHQVFIQTSGKNIQSTHLRVYFIVFLCQFELFLHFSGFTDNKLYRFIHKYILKVCSYI